MNKRIIFSLAAAVMVSFSSIMSAQSTVSGAGSTFVMPFVNAAFPKFAESAGIKFTYGGVGSGAGIRSLKDRVVDFGASDAFLTEKEAAEMPAKVVEFPICSGGVVIAYNLPGITSIKLTPAVLSDIFLGKIKNWNDAALKKLNPGVKFPNKAITVVYRSDGSGTTAIFTDYLSKVSKEWKEKVGAGKTVNWPTGISAKGNPGVAGTITTTEGALGYEGSEYALLQKTSTVYLQNKSGKFIKATVASISAAGKDKMPADTRVMITDSSNPAAYPIAGFTWFIVYKEQNYNNRSLKQAQDLLKLLDWSLSAAPQEVAKKLSYAPLPASVVALNKRILRSVTYNGKPILK